MTEPRTPTSQPVWFRDDGAQAIDDLWAVYDPNFEQVWYANARDSEALRDVFEQLPAPLLSTRCRESHEAVRRGFNGDWSSYEELLKRLAGEFVRLEVSFGAWYSMGRALSQALEPLLADSLAHRPDQHLAALRAMQHYIASLLKVVGQEFVLRLSAQASWERQREQEEERTAIARVLHDELAQSLVVAKMDLAGAERLLHATDQAAVLQERLSSADASIASCLSIVHRLLNGIRTPLLDDLGLGEAIAWKARDFERQSGIRVEVDVPWQPLSVGPARETAIYRALEDLLRRLALAEGVTELSVHLSVTPRGVVLELVDDRGPEQGGDDPGGRRVLAERVRASGGVFSTAAVSPGRRASRLEFPRWEDA